MLEYVFRFSIEKGRTGEFLQWVRDNDQALRDHTSEGWTYLGMWFTARAFGDYQVESRHQVADYASLGGDLSDEGRAVLAEFLSFVDSSRPNHATLLRSAATVQLMAEPRS